jgi:hypothetical protein
MAGDSTTGNRFLDLLPHADRQRLLEGHGVVALERGERQWGPDKDIEEVLFPQDAVISLRTVLPEGGGVEAGVIGNEGVAGLPAFFGTSFIGNIESVCQVPGKALKVQIQTFEREVERGRSLNRLMGAWTHYTVAQAAQSAACNRAHSLEERTARWLLQFHDRTEGDEFPLTQEFLAEMLGVHRPSVSIAAGILQKAGLVRYTRGMITILDRPGLEAACCGCYSELRSEYDRVMRGSGKLEGPGQPPREDVRDSRHENSSGRGLL